LLKANHLTVQEAYPKQYLLYQLHIWWVDNFN